MQEDQTVTFQPIYEGHRLAWFEKLYVLYLLFVVVVFLVRAVQIGSALRKLRRLEKHSENPATACDDLWSGCSQRINSLNRFAVLTFLLSMLDSTLSIVDILSAVRTEKSMSAPFILSEIGEALVPLSMGLMICTALYVAAMLGASALRCRQSVFTSTAPQV